MATLVFFFVLWLVCKGIKALFRPRRKVTAPAPAASRASGSPVSAVIALQEQRRIIEEQLSDIEEQLDNCPPAKLRNQYLNRKTVLLGKLASVEQRIYRMCA